MNARPRRMRRIAVALAALIVCAFVLPIGFVAAFGSSMVKSAMPKFANTNDRLKHAELMRPYALPADPSIDPLRAGEAFHSLGNRTGYKYPAALRAPAHGPFDFARADTALFRGAGPSAWAGPSPLHLLELARKGFSRAEMDYLAQVAGSPVWEQYATVARAPRMDLAGAMYVIPFPAGSSPFAIPITRFAATKEVAYASVARAALDLANNRPKDAELALREIVSNGFRLVDDGNSLIDQLIGVVVIGIGRSGLEQLYQVTNDPELARLRAATTALDKAEKAAPAESAGDLGSLPAAIADSTRSRGLRMELTLMSSLTVCTSVRDLMFGPPGSLESAQATARRQLVRSDAEGALFDLNVHAVDHPSPGMLRDVSTGIGPRTIIWIAKIPSFLLHNPRIVNCAALVTSTLRGS